MQTKLLNDYKVLTFDCYGTLIDWESGIWDALQPLIMYNRRSDIKRRDGLALFAEHEHDQEGANPDMLYPQILERVHDAMVSEWGMQTTKELTADFGCSVARWPAFPDSADALRYLKTRFKLVILSNVNRDGFAASNLKLGVEFDAIYTAEDVGSYKPDPANFEYMLDRLHTEFALQPSEVLHTAQSILHDHVQAKAFGLANAWIDRQRLSQGGDWGATAPVKELPKTDFVFFSMSEMVDAVIAEGRRGGG